MLFILATFQTANAEWIKQDAKTLAWLRTIDFVDENTGWIGGSRGTFLATTDGGKSWQKLAKFTDDTVREIVFLDKSTGWLLIERDVFSLGTKSPTYLMKTVDGGKNWSKIEFENKQKQRITKIFFASNGFGLAIGETGALYGLEDNDSNWKKLAAPSNYLMLDGVFTDNLHSTVVGGGGMIIFSEDAGVSWNQAIVAGNEKTRLNSVFFINAKNGWTAGSNGKIYQTVNGGKYWRSQNTNTTKNINDIFFKNTADGWAVGDDGTILYSTTGGNVWQKFDSKINHKLEKVFFNGSRGWIIGFGGTILSYKSDVKFDGLRPQLRTN